MRSFDVGGPDVMTYRETVELAFACLGREPRLRALPPWVLSAAAPVVGLLNPFVGDLIRSLRSMAAWEAVAPTCGTHHLADFYRTLAAASSSSRS
jgi:hypothetical protein